MNINELTTTQLRRALGIREHIDRLNTELNKLLDGGSNDGSGKGRLSPAARRRIAAAQRARWAKARKAKPGKPATKSAVKKTKMSAAARAKVAARMRAYWKLKKAGKKTASPKK